MSDFDKQLEVTFEDKIFSRDKGGKVDIISYTLDQVKKDPSCSIYVGCDSINRRDFTVYYVVIAYRYGSRISLDHRYPSGKGVHYIWKRYKVPRVRDMWSRLWNEMMYSLKFSKMIQDQTPIKIDSIDLDFNEDEFAGSNALVSACRGTLMGYGFKVNVKPDMQVAAKAADHLCNKKA